MTIVRCDTALDLEIEFENGYRRKAQYQAFKNGSVKCPYDKSVFNHGYLGEGKHKPSVNKKLTPEYKIWYNIIKRVYDHKIIKKYPTYKGCSICEEWHNFQNFAEWYSKKFYSVHKEKMHIDKDILVKRNKIYSPNTCIFVPERINNLFIKCNANRGKYPIGVYFKKDIQKYMAITNDLNRKSKYLGYYNTPENAFLAYKEYKEKIIKEVANEYKGLIPDLLYKTMINYKVEIED